MPFSSPPLRKIQPDAVEDRVELLRLNAARGKVQQRDVLRRQAVADGLQIRQTALVVPRYEESYEDWRTIEQPEIWLRDDEP